MSARNEPTRLNMTPMIDVVFQLIVFFLVSMKFKTLDMRIDTLLPKDGGIVPVAVRPPQVPVVSAVLKRGRSEPATRVRVGNQTIGEISEATDRRVATIATMSRLSSLASDARARAGNAAAEVRGEVDASPLVPAADVIRAVDAFLQGGIANVTFVGTPQPEGPPDRIR